MDFKYLLLVLVSALSIANEPRIVGGQQSPVNAYPFALSLQIENFGHICGGSYLGDGIVLTAAHCVGEDSNSAWLDSAFVESGSNVLGGGSRSNVARLTAHPDYNSDYFINDYALLKLDNNLTVPSVNLVNSSEFSGSQRASSLTVVGWGLTEFDELPSQQRYVEVDLWSTARCRAVGELSEAEFGIDIATGFCAASVGKDSCNGDSGGPIFTELNGQVTQYGLVSWGSSECDGTTPGIYARLDNQAAWLAAAKSMLLSDYQYPVLNRWRTRPGVQEVYTVTLEKVTLSAAEPSVESVPADWQVSLSSCSDSTCDLRITTPANVASGRYEIELSSAGKTMKLLADIEAMTNLAPFSVAALGFGSPAPVVSNQSIVLGDNGSNEADRKGSFGIVVPVTGPGVLRWQADIESEYDYDFFEVALLTQWPSASNFVFQQSSDQPLMQLAGQFRQPLTLGVSVPAGEHLVELRYRKDEYLGFGRDQVVISDVQFIDLAQAQSLQDWSLWYNDQGERLAGNLTIGDYQENPWFNGEVKLGQATAWLLALWPLIWLSRRRTS